MTTRSKCFGNQTNLAQPFNQNLTGGYEDQWQAVLDREASHNDVKIVCIYSWNSYDERSAIEPEIDYTVPNLDPWYLLSITRSYVAQLRNPPITIMQWLVPTTVVVILIVIVNMAFFVRTKTKTKQTE
jgi:hypothetical protein